MKLLLLSEAEAYKVRKWAGLRTYRVSSAPIRDDKALEIKLFFEQGVEHMGALATLGSIDAVVDTHNSSRPGTDGLCKRP